MTEKSEQMLVLELLREGRLSPEQAERLLRALSAAEGPAESRGRRPPIFHWLEQEGKRLDLDAFGREIERSMRRFADEFKGFFRETRGERPAPERKGEGEIHERHELPRLVQLQVDHEAGPLRIETGESDAVLEYWIRGPEPKLDFQQTTHEEGEERAQLISARGALRVALPRRPLRELIVQVKGGPFHGRGWSVQQAQISVAGGPAKLEEPEGALTLTVHGGPASVRSPRGPRLVVETVGGPLHVENPELSSFEELALKVRGGPLTLRLSEQPHCEVHYSVIGGPFRSDWEGEALGSGRLRLGSGGPVVRLDAVGGPVRISR
ncbi:MAG: hypothetical protein KatS3mg115_2621 [Candidatus Poribacteria bacterium]|nr:MAG: hypothetical protein KatS3mg115_2621 [Candidatus Poribacteria bacterium]